MAVVLVLLVVEVLVVVLVVVVEVGFLYTTVPGLSSKDRKNAKSVHVVVTVSVGAKAGSVARKLKPAHLRFAWHCVAQAST